MTIGLRGERSVLPMGCGLTAVHVVGSEEEDQDWVLADLAPSGQRSPAFGQPFFARQLSARLRKESLEPHGCCHHPDDLVFRLLKPRVYPLSAACNDKAPHHDRTLCSAAASRSGFCPFVTPSISPVLEPRSSSSSRIWWKFAGSAGEWLYANELSASIVNQPIYELLRPPFLHLTLAFFPFSPTTYPSSQTDLTRFPILTPWQETSRLACPCSEPAGKTCRSPIVDIRRCISSPTLHPARPAPLWPARSASSEWPIVLGTYSAQETFLLWAYKRAKFPSRSLLVIASACVSSACQLWTPDRPA